MCSCMLQATRDGIEIGAARLDRLDAATNVDGTQAALEAEARLASSAMLPLLRLHQPFPAVIVKPRCTCSAPIINTTGQSFSSA